MSNSLDYSKVKLPKNKFEAKNRGYRFYFTGKPCINYNHVSVRRVENDMCLDCEIEGSNDDREDK